MKRKTLTTGDIADYCGVNFRTVIRWIERGYLKAHKLPGRGDHRVQPSDFVAFLEANDMPVPDEFKPQAAPPAAAPSDSPQGILIIEDYPDMAKAIARVLKKTGRAIDIANNGFEAGLKVAQQTPELITLDLRMPGMSGCEVVKHLRQRDKTKQTPILIISADGKAAIDEALEAGATAALEKPFENAVLLSMTEQLLQ